MDDADVEWWCVDPDAFRKERFARLGETECLRQENQALRKYIDRLRAQLMAANNELTTFRFRAGPAGRPGW